LFQDDDPDSTVLVGQYEARYDGGRIVTSAEVAMPLSVFKAGREGGREGGRAGGVEGR
jgi:hypothetical protein